MMQRHDLVGRSDEPLPLRVARARTALEAAVEPRWRQDVTIADGQGLLAQPPCAVPGCRREMLADDLCAGHHRRWMLRRTNVTWETFIATTKIKVHDWERLRGCLVGDCRVGISGGVFCPEHKRQWVAAGEPPQQDWAGGVGVAKLQGPLCAVVRCELLGSQLAGYCRGHHARWVRLGRPTPEVFEAHLMNYAAPHWDFRKLPEQLKLELQYAMQQAEKLVTAQRRGRHYSYTVRVLLHIGATSLLEHTRAEWDVILCRYIADPHQSSATQWRAWLGFAVEQINDLVDGNGWASEYPRDVWELRRLGLVAGSNQRRLPFTEIVQPWLVELVKRWLHWRITVEEISVVTASSDLKALRRLAARLAQTGQAAHSIKQFNRPVIESYLTWLRTQQLASSTIRDETSSIAVFLRALRDHEDWAPDLPRTAAIYSGDYPRIVPLRARGLSTHVMVQVHEHLHRWRDPHGRFLTELMLGAGLRVGDAAALGFDPLVFDDDGHPYIHYWNHKMRRDAFVPIDRALFAKLREQQQRVAERYPDQHRAFLATPAPRSLPYIGLRLIPRSHVDRNGHEPFKTATYRQQLGIWVTECGITDEAGRPAAITAHRWRHTYATDLINKGVRLEVVKQLLDHASLEMAGHYARLLDTTVRAEWEAVRGKEELPGSADRPGLADAAWNNRARTALPNGLCGLPRQQSCAHSNNCLSCPVFITTSADLPAHEEQRRRTLKLIAELDDRGQTRLADQNRTVLEQLDEHIAQIRRNPDLTNAAGEELGNAG
jgi:integrase